MSPQLSNYNLKRQHMRKAIARAFSCPCTSMQCNPCQAPPKKAPGCPPAAAAQLTLPPARPSGTTVSPLGTAVAFQPFPRAGETLQLLRFCSRYGHSSCFIIIPQSYSFHQPLAVQSHSPNGCSRLVCACSTWSLCGPIAMSVLLSRNAAVSWVHLVCQKHCPSWARAGNKSSLLGGTEQKAGAPHCLVRPCRCDTLH